MTINISEESGSGVPPVWQPPLVLLGICASASVLALAIIAPAIPLLRQEMGVDFDAAQLVLTSFLVASALGQIFAGPISDRVGRKPVMLFGTLIYFLGGVGSFLATDMNWLNGFRVMQGLGASCSIVMVRVIVNDVFGRQEAARQLSSITAIMAIVPILTIALGGVTAELIGWRGNMMITAVAGLVQLAFLVYLMRETNASPVDRLNPLTVASNLLFVLGKPAFLSHGAVSTLQAGIFFSMAGFMPYQFARLGAGPAEFGFWFSATSLGYMFGNITNRRLSQRIRIEQLVVYGTFASMFAICLMILTWLLGAQHPAWLSACCALFGMSNGICIANSMICAMRASGQHAGSGAGLVGAGQMAAGGLAGTIVIGLGGATSFAVCMIISMILVCLSILGAVIGYRLSLRLSD
jgi:DHA1 family bicyclomycin/chloramphenicol resistance-like MFS transporter